MKSSTKKGLKILGLIILISGVVIFFAFIFSLVGFIYSCNRQMTAGRAYMDSLTEKDILVWIDRTKKYLDEYDPKADKIGAKPVPPELKKLKILRIDEGTNFVGYVWMGGMDHTELFVERMADGSFQFTAGYNDESNKVIWPKTPNKPYLQTNNTFHLTR
jgi:preprotein translocase subunit SecE